MGLTASCQGVAYIGVGSNLDGPECQVLNAMKAIDHLPNCEVTHTSRLYASEPIGYAHQPEYVNAVCSIKTSETPTDLLRQLLELEVRLGRVRVNQPNRPRSIDLDLLLYDTEVIDSDNLKLPHPRMHQRRFVLEPLLEISPHAIIPNRGKASTWLAQCANQHVSIID